MKTFPNFTRLLAAISASAALAMVPANAAVILASDFTGVSKSGNIADSFSWDTVNGIDTPTTSLAFVDPGNSNAALSFFNVTANEIDVNENIGTGGQWKTSFVLNLNAGTSAINLTTLDLNVRLANGSGGDNTTGSKDGIYTVQILGSTSSNLGSASSPVIEYASVSGNAVSIDLSSFADLNQSETYTVNLSLIRDDGNFGHHISLQDLSLSGSITAIPEPSIALLGAIGFLVLLRRRR
jgi:hypothetical protein